MRQVQIAAGSLVVLGLLIPHGWWLALFVGAGLVFAGISGTCGMAVLLSRMPWNRQKTLPFGSTAASCTSACSTPTK
ncbi:MAG: DUF2892 domain-containing protein [Candidatus Omnitrophica bacterium]|nr:DUF2892 domain-containing protein [Candidatus Omnitrophota bacterium]